MSKLLHFIRYSSFSLLWVWVSGLIIRLGGAKAAAYMSYLSIDWGEMHHDCTVLCLSRDSFIKDIVELRSRTKINYPMIQGGFTRFQMAWTPEVMQHQTFYQGHSHKHDQAVKLSLEYAYHLVRLIKKKCPVDAILSANFDYWQDAGFKQVCKELGIPFLVLSREHPVIPKVCGDIVQWYKDSSYRFEGAAIAVAGQSTRDVILKVSTICSPKQVKITGLPRYDAWLDVDTSQILSERPFITLLTFTEGYYADQTFEEVLILFCEAAGKNTNASVDFLIKSKDPSDTEQVQKIMKKNGLSGVQCTHERSLFDLLPKSRMVINYNSLSLVEAVMARALVVIPVWGQCKAIGEEVMYDAENSKVTKVVQFAYDQDEFLALIASSVAGQTISICDDDVSGFLDEYIYFPKNGSCCAEFVAFIGEHIQPIRAD